MLKRSLNQAIFYLNTRYYQTSSVVYNDLRSFKAQNEPILDYKVNSNERNHLKVTLSKYLEQELDIPIVIGDEEIHTDDIKFQVAPFEHKRRIARYYYADKQLIELAIKNNLSARADWEATPLEKRAEIFLKAADTLSTVRRSDIIASTMLGQAKTVYQAEIDAACELIDFLRFNVQYAFELLKYKPSDAPNTINTMDYRGMEGFVAAISPFNFTAIGGNLSTAPALMGNTVIWKPSDQAVLASYVFYKILRNSGLPPGVINFVPSNGPDFGETIIKSKDLAGINFTGSVPTFRWLWRNVGQNIDTYRTFPRLSGECGGKNYHLIHASADIKSAIYATIRSAFEYSGQKCSACSRLYVPESKWLEIKTGLIDLMKELKIGSPLEFDTFTSSVIDEKSFDRIQSYIDYASKSDQLKAMIEPRTDKSKGYYIYPTIFRTNDPRDRIMSEEIFGPILTVFVYKESQYDDVLKLIDQTTPYALTGAIFAQDEAVLKHTMSRLRHSQGNLYINDKSTGAVVNQQPFGGSRLSGTNDKPGGPHNIIKWLSPLSIKRYFLPQSSYKHVSMLDGV